MYLFPISGLLLLFLCGCAVKAQTANVKTIKDQSGNEYNTIQYGMQNWTSKNLSVSRFRNGDIIPQAKTDEEWKNAGLSKKPVWCYYNNDPENGKKYGKLYNWYAINDRRGLAPKGWHIPDNADWSKLVKNLNGIDIAGTKLKSKTGWKNKKGSDLIGFSALPGGMRSSDGKFESLDEICRWWSNSVPVEAQPTNAIFSVQLNDKSVEVGYLKTDKACGLSVRCIKDK